MFGTAYPISILKSLPKFLAGILVPFRFVAATDRQIDRHKHIFLCYTDEATTEQNTFFTVEDVCGNLLGLNISVMIKFKYGYSEKFTNC